MPRLISEAAKKAKVPRSYRMSTGVDVVGDIVIVRLGKLSLAAKRRFGKAILAEVPNVKAVYDQEGGIEGEFRLRKVEHIAGDKRTLTVHKENGCSFKVDIASCYFSPRLATERLRVAREVRKGEKVLNMFAGVGPFSILIAKLSGAKVLSCEINPEACAFHEENDRKNKVDGLVKVVRSDAMELLNLTKEKFHRVIMPHPSQSDMFLPTALKLLRKGGTIYYYRHVLGRNPEEGAEAIGKELHELLPRGAKLSARKVRAVGPRWLEMCAEIRL